MSGSASRTEANSSLAGLLARVANLPDRSSKAQDLLRLRYVQALARRAESAEPGVQAVLQESLVAALARLEAQVGHAGTPQSEQVQGQGQGLEAASAERASHKAVPRVRAGSSSKERCASSAPLAPVSLLGQLNAHIETAGGGDDLGVAASEGQNRELRSAVRFRETWARLCAEAEVEQASHRAPENAGPLNAHHLVLRMLGLMRELSPDYLRRFLGYSESLLWLDQGYARLKQPTAKARPARAKPRS
jgi:hypothetical protein